MRNKIFQWKDGKISFHVNYSRFFLFELPKGSLTPLCHQNALKESRGRGNAATAANDVLQCVRNSFKEYRGNAKAEANDVRAILYRLQKFSTGGNSLSGAKQREFFIGNFLFTEIPKQPDTLRPRPAQYQPQEVRKLSAATPTVPFLCIFKTFSM